MNQISLRSAGLDSMLGMKKLETPTGAILLCLLFFFFYAFLVINYPVAYWIDAHLRLAQRDQILVGYWLPTIQVLVFIVSKLGGDLLFLRILLSLIATGTLFCIYYLANLLFSTSSGIFALILLGTNLMYVALAIVPYPEVLFAGLIFLTLAFLDNSLRHRYFYPAMLCLNLACLTRYEGWLLAAILVCEEIMRHLKIKGLKEFALLTGKLLLFAFAPLVWILFVVIEPGGLRGRLDGILNFTTGLSSVSLTDRFFTRLNPNYIISFLDNFYHMLSWQLGNGIIIFGVIGLVAAIVSKQKRSSQMRICTFLVLDLFLVAFWSPWNFTNLRQTFILEMFLIFYAAYGLERLVTFVFKNILARLEQANMCLQMKRTAFVLGVFLTAFYIPSTIRFIDQTSHETNFLVPAENGRWLNSRLSTNDAIFVLSDDPFQIYALATYISLPMDSILDDRFDTQYMLSHLNATNQIYVVSLYESREGLSMGEAELLDELENGDISAFRQMISGRNIWILPSRSLVDYFESKK